MKSNSLYKQEIIDHYKNPKNWGLLKDYDEQKSVSNSSCGDDLTISIKFNKKDEISKIGYEGHGCAISLASMSMLSEKVLGMKRSEVMELDERYVLGLVNMEGTSGRKKCATLSLEGVKKVLF